MPNTGPAIPAAENQSVETPNPLSLVDTVWNQIAASMDYPIYVLNAVVRSSYKFQTIRK